jgi:hypothetical protein
VIAEVGAATIMRGEKNRPDIGRHLRWFNKRDSMTTEPHRFYR